MRFIYLLIFFFASFQIAEGQIEVGAKLEHNRALLKNPK